MTELERMLRAERTNLREELERVRVLIADSEQRLTAIIARLRHVDGLLGDDDDSGDPKDGTTSPEVARVSSSGESITDLAEQILVNQPGKPMYYKELAKEVQRLGGTIAGVNPAATLVARLVNDERFVRPTSKGFYGLRKDFPNARNVGARVKRAFSRVRNN